MSIAVRIVFDAEPLIAYLNDEPGADKVEEYLDKLESGIIYGFISPVTLTEVKYICERELAEEKVNDFFNYLFQFITVVETAEYWKVAARLKNQHNIALGDAFTLATRTRSIAEGRVSSIDPPVKALVGADDDFDDVENIIRFRSDPA